MKNIFEKIKKFYYDNEWLQVLIESFIAAIILFIMVFAMFGLVTFLNDLFGAIGIVAFCIVIMTIILFCGEMKDKEENNDKD